MKTLTKTPGWLACAVLAVALMNTGAHAQHTWQMAITVDNQYDIYFGDQFLTTPNFVGGDTDWTNTETYTVTGVNPNDYLYVATASDHSVAQGFIGDFTNLTTSASYPTSQAVTSPWEVFPAGQYLAALNAIDGTIPATGWTPGVQPTASQVQTAVAYATTNTLWIDPTSAPGYANGSAPSPWGARSGISATAEWIWHDTGGTSAWPYADPFGGFDHDEFLVFRVPGVNVPEPSGGLLLLLASAAGVASRRRGRR